MKKLQPYFTVKSNCFDLALTAKIISPDILL
jgi:hypothetical protein